MEYAVIGIGRFGSAVALELVRQGKDVVAIDILDERLKSVADTVNQTFILDATDEKALKDISIEHIDNVVVGMGKSSITQSLLTCLALKNVGVKNIIAKASTASHQEILEKIGVNQVINPEYDMGTKLGRQLSNASILEYFRLSDEVRIEGLVISKKNKKFVNKTIQELNLRKHYGINIVCIKRGSELIIVENDTEIYKDDIVVIVGENEKMDIFERKNGLTIASL